MSPKVLDKAVELPSLFGSLKNGGRAVFPPGPIFMEGFPRPGAKTAGHLRIPLKEKGIPHIQQGAGAGRPAVCQVGFGKLGIIFLFQNGDPDLFHCAAMLWAVEDAGGGFIDFELRGVVKQ